MELNISLHYSWRLGKKGSAQNDLREKAYVTQVRSVSHYTGTLRDSLLPSFLYELFMIR